MPRKYIPHKSSIKLPRLNLNPAIDQFLRLRLSAAYCVTWSTIFIATAFLMGPLLRDTFSTGSFSGNCISLFWICLSYVFSLLLSLPWLILAVALAYLILVPILRSQDVIITAGSIEATIGYFSLKQDKEILIDGFY